MVTTVTPAVTTTITTAGGSSLALIAIFTMLVLLITKEILLTGQHERAVRLNRAINVALVPLLIIFVTTAALNVIAVLK